MYVNVGKGKNLREKDIIGIFDTDNTTVSKTTQKYLNSEQDKKRLISMTSNLPKSFVITKEKTFLIGLAPKSLYGRLSDKKLI